MAVNVLHFTIGGPDFTGIASILYLYYKYIDQNLVRFDFACARQNPFKMVCEDPVFENSAFIELNAVKGKNKVSYTKLVKELYKVLKGGKYDVFHINTHRCGVVLACMLAAKLCGIKAVVTHSHSVIFNVPSKTKRNPVKDLFRFLCGEYIRKESDYIFGCSENAGKAMVGTAGVKQNNFYVLKNAIESEKYSYKAQDRERIRTAEGVGLNTVVFGQVGRLCLQKNQKFALTVFAEIKKRIPDAKFWIIGTGEDQAALAELTRKLGLQDDVCFLGQRNDVQLLMQGMDAVMVPSYNEGLGIVAIEAQAAGLPVYASDALPEEARVTDLIRFLPLEDGAESWAAYIEQDICKHERRNTQADLAQCGYDIESAAKWLENFYINCANR